VYWVGKRQKWEAVGRNKKDAERRLVDVLSRLHDGTYQPAKPITFDEFSGQWLRNYAEGAVKPSTLRRYRGFITHYLNPAFGSLPLTAITPETVQQYMSRAPQEHGAAPRTVNHSLVLLKLMLKHAKQWRYLRENPAQEIRRLRVEAQEMDYLKPEEIRLLLQHADEPYQTLFLTAVLTGMRRSEVLALQWGDIDWTSSVIRVRRSIFWYTLKELNGAQVSRWHFMEPKSKRSMRTLVMSPNLREALELHRLSAPVSQHDLVFCTKQGGPIDPRHLVEREFLPTLSRAGLRRVRFHDLRHTYTALMIAQGANIKFIQSQLGHASIQTTLDRYGHLLPEVQRGVGERLDAAVFGQSDGDVLNITTPTPSGAGDSGSR
jgi:integrase